MQLQKARANWVSSVKVDTFFLLWMFAAKLRFRSTVSKAALFCSRTHFEFSFYHHQKKWERKKGEQKRDSGSQRTNERTAVVKQRDTSTRNGTVFSAAFYWRLSSIIFFIDHCPNNRISNLVTFKGLSRTYFRVCNKRTFPLCTAKWVQKFGGNLNIHNPQKYSISSIPNLN